MENTVSVNCVGLVQRVPQAMERLISSTDCNSICVSTSRQDFLTIAWDTYENQIPASFWYSSQVHINSPFPCPCMAMKRNRNMHFVRDSSVVHTTRGPGLIQGSSVPRQMCTYAGYEALVIGSLDFLFKTPNKSKLQDYCNLGNCSCHWSFLRYFSVFCQKINWVIHYTNVIKSTEQKENVKTWFSCLSIAIKCLLRYFSMLPFRCCIRRAWVFSMSCVISHSHVSMP